MSEKNLSETKNEKAGRSQGKISVRGRGGGHKRKYRKIDFKRKKFDIEAKVKSIEYDPNRSADVALLVYNDGEKRYIIAPDELEEGDEVKVSKEKIKAKVGNRMPLKHIPMGSSIYNVELKPGKGSQMVRSAGNMAQVLTEPQDGMVQVKLPSDEIRLIDANCFATIGRVSNPEHINEELEQAGDSRHRGRRPKVRGTAKNPVDHPHGGGEGRTGPGRIPKTASGKKAHGKKTRKQNKESDKYIIKRRDEN